MRYENHGLFSNHFISTRLSEMPEWREARVPATLAQRARAAYEQALPGLERANEAQTEQDLIRPLLDLLAVPYDVQTGLAAWTGRSVPDYAVFDGPAERLRATAFRGSDAFWDMATAVGDAKAFNIELDQVGAGGRRRTPAQQLSEYMRDADVTWGVLTNGRRWRLYSRANGKRSRDYFEMNLEHAIYGSEEELRLFWLVFGRDGLTRGPDGRTFNEKLLSGSVEYATGIGERLRDRAFKTIETLARGIVRHEGWQEPTEEQLARVYESTLVLLYRLLFVLSAEARSLLPMDSDTYRSHYSLARLVGDIRSRRSSQAWAANSCEWYASLRSLFELVDRGDVQLGVPPYDGGLFDEHRYPFLNSTCCPDPELGEAIYQLSFDATDSREEAIDYRDIAPRHLGTIYEGLLEFELAVAGEPLTTRIRNGVETYTPVRGRGQPVVREGEVFLRNDKGARRATGSYYTPDYIVDYMVSAALRDPLQRTSVEVSERLSTLEARLVEASSSQERAAVEEELLAARRDVADELMRIRVLDPAMGSGHFLVAAMHHIADSVYTHPAYEIPSEDPHGVLLRRRIAERCLFGVDLNELAVELARLTIWLETVAPDRPLSFLDHHLKVGNSLIGSTITEASYATDARRHAQEVSMVESVFRETLPEIIGELVQVSASDPATTQDVLEKQHRMARVNALREPYRMIADARTAIFGFDAPGDQQLLDDAIFGIRNADLWSKVTARTEWSKSLALAREWHAFHWEIEFPEVFFDRDGVRLDNAGFDIVIGNPPYEVLETRRSDYVEDQRYKARLEQLRAERSYFRSGSYRYAVDMSQGKLDYFRLFSTIYRQELYAVSNPWLR